MMQIKTTKGTWRIYGIYITPPDSTFQRIKQAIDSNNLRESYLKIITGHPGRILIDHASKEIRFLSF